jgi:hypothetical protein
VPDQKKILYFIGNKIVAQPVIKRNYVIVLLLDNHVL